MAAPGTFIGEIQLADFSADGDAIAIGQAEVEDNEVGARGRCKVEGFASGRCLHYRSEFVCENVAYRAPDVRVVFDYERGEGCAVKRRRGIVHPSMVAHGRAVRYLTSSQQGSAQYRHRVRRRRQFSNARPSSRPCSISEESSSGRAKRPGRQ